MKDWLLSRLKENSTKYGLALTGALVAIFLSADQIGEYANRLTAAAALFATLRLIMTQETQG